MNYLEEDGIVFAEILNPLSLEGTKQFCIELNETAHKHDAHKYLVDHRGVDVVMTVLEIDKIPGMLREIEADFGGRTAILLDSSAPKGNLFHFLKNLLHLASVRFELFFDRDEAIAWLKAG
jgi:hypothetical protein